MLAICKCCGEEYVVQKNTRGIYCSNKCQGEHQRRKTEEEFWAGTRVPDRRYIRAFLINKYGHKCDICNGYEWMGQPIPLELDHVDGNASNNKHENLRKICPNCHAQTPTWKAKNKGKGRKTLGISLG